MVNMAVRIYIHGSVTIKVGKPRGEVEEEKAGKEGLNMSYTHQRRVEADVARTLDTVSAGLGVR